MGGDVEQRSVPASERRFLPAIKGVGAGPAGRMLVAGAALAAGLAVHRLVGSSGSTSAARSRENTPLRWAGKPDLLWIRVEEHLEAGRLSRTVEALVGSRRIR
ncbi:hypothetical protein [Rubrobacter calidifluminis]|uniref:hypothetical protein n=1 Tax=Rubrobacter calidifluminis TaxID=1392640 RepID=UPI00235E0E0F|nr:hypothetical protein [Rubrobacter calidifluminis]